jgi:hypothetical protein
MTGNTCPHCHGSNYAKIIYGLVADMHEVEELMRKGKIALGGCCITGADPNRQCNNCGTRW